MTPARVQQTVYSDTAPGRCYHCKQKLARVSAGKHRGKFAYVPMTDEIGNAVVSHVTCYERHGTPRITARQPDGNDVYMPGEGLHSFGRVTYRRRGAE